MIETRPYTPDDRAEILAWLLAWGRTVDPAVIPPGGVVVDGVAAGFLYETDTPAVGIMELLVSNPKVSKAERGEALDAVFRGLVSLAKRRGCRVIWGVTSHETVARRMAAKHGFTVDARRFYWVDQELP